MAKKGTLAKRERPPAITLEARENELISLAVNEAEKRIANGTASDSLIIHYLRLGTSKSQLEKEKLEADVELQKAKAESIRQAERIEDLYSQAIDAMRVYSGNGSEDDYD